MEQRPSPLSASPRGRALSFGAVADAYDRARPSYPREAAEWLTGRVPSTVVELGAGTGKFTELLLALGHDVLATDPLDEMLAHLRLRHPDLRVATAPAEQIPAATRSVDTVVAAQSFHWFDPEPALREVARVLKPEGRIALVWNQRDERVPWVRKLGELISTQDQDVDPSDVLVGSRLFGYVEEAAFRHWQPLRRADLRDLALSRSNVAVLDPSAQERLLRKVDELFDDYSRGPAGLLMPYVARCYRAVVRPRGHIDEPEHSADLTAAAQAAREASELPREHSAPGPPDEDDGPATTLIDFR
jgi:ubiquinone/menaquinone biosynthesis C-methylase UbiE